MQEKSQTFSEFFSRTDGLAGRMGLNLSDLPGVLGISKAMLFAYRSGKQRITSKVWHKLEAAERKAGMANNSGGLSNNEGNPNEFSGEFVKKLEDSGTEYAVRRDAVLRAARERDERLLDGAAGEIAEVLLAVESCLDHMVLRDEAGRARQVAMCRERIDEFAKWAGDYRDRMLSNQQYDHGHT